MPLQPTPVLDLALSGVPIRDISTREVLAEAYWSREKVRSIAAEAAMVDAQVAADLFTGGPMTNYNLQNDFGSLRLPFPKMWFEWSHHVRDDFTKLKPQRELPNARVQFGALLTEHALADGTFEVRAQEVSRNARNELFGNRSYSLVHLDSEGRPLHEEVRFQHGYGSDGMKLPFGKGRHLLIPGNHLPFSPVPYLTINLMNCKNVETEERESCSQSRTLSGRRKPKSVRYHTILLPGMRSGGSSNGEYRDMMALHRVRGHFKTYTEKAPLLGKFIGTYWWGWQVRGNKQNGISVTDYKIGQEAKASA